MRESIFREPSSLLSFSHHRYIFLNYFLHCSQYSHNFLQFRVMLPQDFDQSPLPQSLNAQSSRFHWIGHNKLWFHKYLVTNSFLPNSGTRWSNFPGLQSATEQVVGAGGRLGVCLLERAPARALSGLGTGAGCKQQQEQVMGAAPHMAACLSGYLRIPTN